MRRFIRNAYEVLRSRQPGVDRYVVLLITETRSHNREYVQLEHVAFFDSDGCEVRPLRVDHIGGSSPPHEQAPNVLTDSHTKWLDFAIGQNGWSMLVFAFPRDSTISRYRLTTANDCSERDPISWELHSTRFPGEIDLVQRHGWELLHRVERCAAPLTRHAPYEVHEITGSTGDADEMGNDLAIAGEARTSEGQCLVRAVVLRIEATRSLDDGCVQLSRVRFFGGDGAELRPSSVHNTGGTSPYGEEAKNLLTSSVHTKWLDRRMRAHGESVLVFEFSRAVEIASYTLTTANDAPSRDPSSWTLSGSPEPHLWLQDVRGDEWRVLDVRTQHPLPLDRHCDYEPMELNFGTEAIAEISYEEMSGRYLPNRALQMASSSEVSEVWASTREVAEAYRAARSLICLHPDLIGSSCISDVLAKLKTRAAARESDDAEAERVLMHCIGKAYSVEDKVQIRRQRCLIGDYHLLRDCLGTYASLSWRRPYLLVALELIAEHEDASALISVLSIIARGGRECQARKLMAFNSAIVRASEHCQDTMQEASHSSDCDEADRLISDIRARVATYVDEYKRRAFQSAFLEPSMMLFNMMGQHTLEGDVEVHGSNVYAAVILSTLGMRLPLRPFLDDEMKACCEFLSCDSLRECFDILIEPQMLGKSWKSISSLKQLLRTRRNISRCAVNRFCVSNACLPKTVANAAVSDDPAGASERRCVATYMERFAGLFTGERMFEPLAVFLVTDERCKQLLPEVFRCLRAAANDGDPILQADDVEEFLFDVDGDYALKRTNCQALLARLRVIGTPQ